MCSTGVAGLVVKCCEGGREGAVSLISLVDSDVLTKERDVGEQDLI